MMTIRAATDEQLYPIHFVMDVQRKETFTTTGSPPHSMACIDQKHVSAWPRHSAAEVRGNYMQETCKNPEFPEGCAVWFLQLLAPSMGPMQ